VPAHLELTAAGGVQTYPCATVTTIGRDPLAVVCVDDPRLSRQHAIVRRLTREQYYLLDLGSRNGTMLNGRRVSTATLLQDGDALQLGDSTLRFCLSGNGVATSRDLPPLAETVANQDLGICTLTVLVADMRRFSVLSELLPIRTLSELMSVWFSEVQQAIEANQGELDKFMGDGVLAYWRHRDNDNLVFHQSLLTALAIANITGTLHQRFTELPTPLRVGAGIHTGQAAFTAGLVNTALGDTVNLAFRLEEATKDLGRDLVLSEDSRQLNRPAPEGYAAEIAVRGRSQPVRVHAYTWQDLTDWLAASH
jgi:adenylate cyclase